MDRDIITKLNGHIVDGGIENEAGVTYLLVQLAKLVERADRKGEYPHLMFYRNWAVHARLDHTEFLIAKLEKVVDVGGAKGWDVETIDAALSAEMRRSLAGLHAEMRTAFASFRDTEHGTEFLEAVRSEECSWWKMVSTLLLAVLTDIPLKARGGTIKELVALERGPQKGELRISCSHRTFEVGFDAG